MDIPPHLQGVETVFAVSVSLNSEVLVVQRKDVMGRLVGYDELWPVLTEDEQRLVLTASLLTGKIFVGHETVELLGVEVMLWRDGEIWVPIHNVRARYAGRKEREQRKSAETV